MPADTNKVLTEIANLTKNMDVLLKEMRESNKVVKTSSEAASSLAKNVTGKDGNLEKMFGDLVKSMDSQTKETKGMYEVLNSTLGSKDIANLLSNKNLSNIKSGKTSGDIDLSSILGDKPGDALGNIVGDKIGDKIGSKLESTLEGKIPDVIASVISNALGSVAANFAKGIPSMIANVKGGEKLDLGSIIGGGNTNGLIKGITSKIPGLKKGGMFKKGGLSVVGEDGPELLVGNSGEQIVSNENLKGMLEGTQGLISPMIQGRDDLDAKQNVKWMSLLGSTGLFKGDAGFGQIEKFIDYVYEERQDDIQEILSDPDSLKDEISYFLSEQGRETFTQSDVGKLAQPVAEKSDVEKLAQPVAEKKQTVEQIVSPMPLASPKESNESGESSGGSKESLMDRMRNSSSISSVTDKLKEKLKADGGDPSTKIGSMVNSATNLAEKVSSSNPNINIDELKQKAMDGASALKDTIGNKKAGSSQDNAAPTTKVANNTSASSGSTNLSTSGVGDIGELKGILTAIYQALKSPLTVANDVPFRPSSNNF